MYNKGWENQYYRETGQVVEHNTKDRIYGSIYGTNTNWKGDAASKDNPYNTVKTPLIDVGLWGEAVFILSGGLHEPLTRTYANSGIFYVGQGVDQTFINSKHRTHMSANQGARVMMSYNDMTVLSHEVLAGTFRQLRLRNCRIFASWGYSSDRTRFSKIFNDRFRCHSLNSWGNTFVELGNIASDVNFDGNYNLYYKCEILITQKSLDMRNRMFGFDDCTFRFPDSEDPNMVYRIDKGSVRDMRYNFINLCEVNGLTIPEVQDETEETGRLHRWVLDSGGTNEGDSYSGSNIAEFEDLHNIILGHNQDRGLRVRIKKDAYDLPNSFNEDGMAVRIVDDSLVSNYEYIDGYGMTLSNIIWLGGQTTLKNINLVSETTPDSSMSLSSVNSMVEVSPNSMSIGQHYLVKDKYGGECVIDVDNKEIKSTDKNNFFRYTGDKALSVISGDLKLMNIVNVALSKTISLRVANTLTDATSAAKGLWCFVAPTDLRDSSGSYVEQSGRKYPPLASFPSDGSPIRIIGKCKLQTAWDVSDGHGFIDVLANDLRALKQGLNPFTSPILIGSDGRPIGTAHPEFTEDPKDGISVSPIVASYVQIRYSIDFDKENEKQRL